MILFHGSNIQIDEIDLSKSKTNKDFGLGFYLSDSKAQALEMAKFKVLTQGGVECVSQFQISDDVLDQKELKTLIFKDYTLEWAKFVLLNRNNSSRIQKHDYDIIYGPIANDKVGLQIRKLENNDIDIEEFMKRIKYMKGITFQYFFGTEKAIKKLKRL